jgi:hypothetical protein
MPSAGSLSGRRMAHQFASSATARSRLRVGFRPGDAIRLEAGPRKLNLTELLLARARP